MSDKPDPPQMTPAATAFIESVFSLSIELGSFLALRDIDEDVILVALYSLTRELEKRIRNRSEAALLAAGETFEAVIKNMHEMADGVNESLKATAEERFPGTDFENMTAQQQRDLLELILAQKGEMPRG